MMRPATKPAAGDHAHERQIVDLGLGKGPGSHTGLPSRSPYQIAYRTRKIHSLSG
jgi:hypothetical protein